MTTSEYKEHFKALLTAEVTYKAKVYTAVKITDIDTYVNRCIGQGLKDFWSAWHWPFKTKEYELSITSQDAAYNLPDDLDSVKSVREKNSTVGLAMLFKSREEFDRLVPKETLVSAGDPEFYTVFWDGVKKKISFFPRPTNQTMYILYNTTPPATVEKVPDIGQACLEAYIAKHVYPHGHPGRKDALIEAENEMQKLQISCKMHKGVPSVMFTETDLPTSINPFYWTAT